MHATTRRATVFFLAAIVLCAAGFSWGDTFLYVAPNGNDAWTGRTADPAQDATDGPLATLAGARDKIREIKSRDGLLDAITVYLRGGVYPITEAITFSAQDSGTGDSPITYASYEGEIPVIHGGRRIEGWRQEGPYWVADVPEGTAGFSALWVNGERRTPARTPNATNPFGDYPTDADFFFAAGQVMEKDAEGKEVKSNTRFKYKEGDIPQWESIDDAVFVVFHSWATSLLRMKSLDTTNQIIEFTGPARWPFGQWRGDQWYYVEHLFEGLDQPGEWYLARKEKKVYYIPFEGEDMAQAEVVAPVARQLILLEGKPGEGAFVEHLNFAGIQFQYTEYSLPPEGKSDAQAAFTLEAAVQAVGARHCTIRHCTVRNVGGYAVWFRTGCQDNRLERSELYDMGAGGVRIGEGGDPATEEGAALRNIVDNCYIHQGGRSFREAVGVWIGRSSYNQVTHNEICDFRYTGVSVGWSWGYAESSANHNNIDYNHIHHIGLGQLNDMGGIYTLGIAPGTTLRHNVIHTIHSNPKLYGGWGLYTDEGSTGIQMENNLVYDTQTGGFHQHYGRENIVRNNILAYSRTGQIIRSREEEHLSFSVERNIVYFNNGQVIGITWKNGNWKMDNNCYWDTSGALLDFAGRDLAAWRAEGFDLNSIVADPLFVDAEHGDFRLKPDSPALKLGFVPFDFAEAGLYGDPEWVAKPRQVKREAFTAP